MDIQTLIFQMTLEEKASLCSGLDFWHTKPIERLQIPSVMISDGPHGLRKQEKCGDCLGVNEGAQAVCFPPACATAASFDRNIIKVIGENIGDACQHEKVGVVLGPAVNIKRSPLCGRNFEYFSEDPFLAGEMAASFSQGVQSRNVGVSVKHFAANNQEHRRMSISAEVDERTMREIYLPAFETVVKQVNPWTVMCSYNRINGIYASENKEYLTDILRGEWGFGGYVVSDWGATNDRVNALIAGLDLEMPASNGTNDQRIISAVQNGELDEEILNRAVRRILTINSRYLDNAKPETAWDMDAQHLVAQNAASECMVLLKNEDALLPLEEGEAIAVIGKFAMKPRFQGGGSSHINCYRSTSLMDALGGMRNIAYAQGYDVYTEKPDAALMAEAVQIAETASVSVIVAGLPEAFESEGYDRTHMRLPECQVELIKAITKVNSNTVVVLYNGAPIEMPWICDVKAVIEAYLGGQAIGDATKDILFGVANPCGRLPETFPLRLEDTPCFLSYGGEKDVAIYNEGLFVGYRYYDKRKMNVLFPFGYGLSYTEFQYSNMKLSTDKMKDTDILIVYVDVTNVGKLPGKDVVQLYVGDQESTVFRPVRELKGFEKVLLQPNEKKTVTFQLGKRAFAYWNTQLHDWHVETGVFVIEIARSSRNIAQKAEIVVESTTIVPDRITVNSTFEDISKNQRAAVMLGTEMNRLIQKVGGGSSSGSVNEDATNMKNALIRYLPLRGIISFSNTQICYDQLKTMVGEFNDNS